MSSTHGTSTWIGVSFFKRAGGSLAAGLLASSAGAAAQTQAVTPESIVHASVSPPMSESEKLVRIASNSYPIRYIFKTQTEVAEQGYRRADEEKVWRNHHA